MLPRSEWHKSITDDRVIDAAGYSMMDFDYPGFCLICGLKQGGVEPDARNYKCESCGAEQVFGAQELALEIDWATTGTPASSVLWKGNPDADGD